MVYRTSSVPQLNSSGGSSGSSYKGSSGGGMTSRGRASNAKLRPNLGKSITPTQRQCGHGQMLPRSRSLNNGMQRLGSQKSTANTSSSRNTPVFLRSRENE